jgi:hypothetical protein
MEIEYRSARKRDRMIKERVERVEERKELLHLDKEERRGRVELNKSLLTSLDLQALL